MATASVFLPGFHSPSASFEQPFEMLHACHERVQRTLALLGRALAHVNANGHDAQSRAAVGDVLRYFDLAAPNHHEDEERHIFPALQDHPDELVRQAVAQLKDDHVHMHEMWQRLRPVLLCWRDDEAAPAPSEDECGLIARFVDAYSRHIPLEECLAYPAAQQRLDEQAIRAIGQEMAARRQAG